MFIHTSIDSNVNLGSEDIDEAIRREIEARFSPRVSRELKIERKVTEDKFMDDFLADAYEEQI